MKNRHNRGLKATAHVAGLALALTACGGSDEDPVASSSSSDTTEAAGSAPRLAVSYENGLAVLDGESLEVIEEFDSEEFTRLNAVGDGRHVLVTTSEGFQVLDTATPELTDSVFAADAAGHVVRHGGQTVLFADGTGETTILDTDALLDGTETLPETSTYRAPEAHHGVSIALEDGTLLTTVGDEETRSGAVALQPDGDDYTEIASNDECPDIHGEGTAAGEAVVFGCSDGALLYRDGTFEKLQAPDEYGRMGNAYVSETSELVVGDYNTDPDDEGYLLNMVALIDTAQGTFEPMALPKGVEYTWRGVVRGPDELAYILATDGSIHVMNPTTGEITDQFPVVEPWEGPADWQNPHPALTVHEGTAYVAEPASNQVHAVDLATGEITASVELDHEPNEMAAALE